MLKRIVMKGVASFPASSEAEIDGLDKVNLIYGANGSGKSTVARFIGSPNAPEFSDCALDEDSNALPCVFDRSFKEKQFQSDALSGIFTLGSGSIELRRELSALESRREDEAARLDFLKESLETLGNEKTKSEDKFARSLHKDLCKAYCDEYPEVFKGFKSSKEKFTALMLEAYGDGVSNPSSLSELSERYRLLFGEAGESGCERLPLLSSEFAALAVSIENDPIWQKSVLGRDDLPISKHISKFGNQDWMRQGMAYADGDVCPFCGRHTIDGKLLKQLDEYFDGSFVKAVDSVANFKRQYEGFGKYVRGYLDGLGEYGDSLRIAGIQAKRLDALKANVLDVVDFNLSKITYKEEHPSQAVALKSSEACLNELCLALLDANRKISAFNELCAAKKQEQAALVRDFRKYLAATKKDLISAYLEQKTALDDRISAQNAAVSDAQTELEDTDKKIAELKRELSGITPSADRINSTLEAHGFHGFKLEAAEDVGSYRLVREDGADAIHTLSEGEETFVAFLYFVESLKSELGREFSGRIVVLDDPVNGLDAETLAVVASITSDIADSVSQGKDGLEQLVVLTHNRDYLAHIFPPYGGVKRYSFVKRDGKSRVIPLAFA